MVALTVAPTLLPSGTALGALVSTVLLVGVVGLVRYLHRQRGRTANPDPDWHRADGGLLVSTLPAESVLPDITVFGEYTYLVTELLWGTIALSLISYAGAFRQTARTVALLYPPAYVWDWYTLAVGVFEIPLRTGIELAGIPLEEHIFILVVPAMVVGTHETLRKLDAEGRLPWASQA